MEKEIIEILNNNDYQKDLEEVKHNNIFYNGKEWTYSGTIIQLPYEGDGCPHAVSWEINEYKRDTPAAMDTIYVLQETFWDNPETYLILQPTEWLEIYRTKNCKDYFE